jgi:hypothetical protein
MREKKTKTNLNSFQIRRGNIHLLGNKNPRREGPGGGLGLLPGPEDGKWHPPVSLALSD